MGEIMEKFSKKRNFWQSLSTIFIVLAILFFASCSSDDDSELQLIPFGLM